MTKSEWREQQRKLPFEEKLRILEDLPVATLKSERAVSRKQHPAHQADSRRRRLVPRKPDSGNNLFRPGKRRNRREAPSLLPQARRRSSKGTQPATNKLA